MFWAKATREPSPRGTSDEQQLEKGQRIANGSFPKWNPIIWHGQAAHLPELLSEDEFAQITAFYDCLESFAEGRTRLVALYETDEAHQLTKQVEAQWSMRIWDTARGQPRAYIPFVSGAVIEFNRTTSPHWNQCLAAYNRAHQLGNLIRLK